MKLNSTLWQFKTNKEASPVICFEDLVPINLTVVHSYSTTNGPNAAAVSLQYLRDPCAQQDQDARMRRLNLTACILMLQWWLNLFGHSFYFKIAFHVIFRRKWVAVVESCNSVVTVCWLSINLPLTLKLRALVLLCRSRRPLMALSRG